MMMWCMGAENEQVEVNASSKLLEIDRKYAAFKVEPKKEEVGDPNIPPHLHAAFELFCMTRNFAQVGTSKSLLCNISYQLTYSIDRCSGLRNRGVSNGHFPLAVFRTRNVEPTV